MQFSAHLVIVFGNINTDTMEQKLVKISPEWETLLKEEFTQPYFKELSEKVRKAYLSKKVSPPHAQMFRAFDMVAHRDVKVVILGQDPYHSPGVADGLAFSSNKNNPIPPSLVNIFKEIKAEFGPTCVKSPDLTHWAEQGVLLLNASLTVRSGEANSHADIGWHEFTDAVIRIISEKEQHIVFMLWGNYARQKKELIDTTKHFILESAHPSPLSAHRGFLGNGHFRNANAYLEKNGRGSIDWCTKLN